MSNSWAYSVGQIAVTTVASIFTGGTGSAGAAAAWSSYFTYQFTGSMTEAYKYGGIAFATSYVSGIGGWEGVVASAAVGCVSASALGGNCGKGAFAAGLGALVTNGVAEGTFGRMVGGGINGYLQTGTTQGFLRGFAAGAIPQDLWFGDAYNKYAFANLGIGIIRDGIRGSLVEGSLGGFGDGVFYGQVTNAVGHLVGLVTTGALPTFSEGAFIYQGTFWEKINGAITFGNVISGSPAMSTDLLRGSPFTVLQHERAHIPQSSILGALYIPVHGLTLGVTHFLPGGDHGKYNFLECSSRWISVPHGASCH